MSRQTKEDIAEIKKRYVAYYADVPVQKYAAMAVGRDQDTIILWRKNDPEFAEAVDQAKSDWVRKRVLETKAEFALERLEKDVFNQNVDITSGGDKIEFVNKVPRRDENTGS